MFQNLKTRILIGIILSCNAYASGCHNAGPGKLNKLIELVNNKEKDIHIMLTEYIADNMKCNIETTSICADSILCKPANEISLHHDTVNMNYEYLSKGPDCISSYLKEYACSSTSGCAIINNETKIRACEGYDNKSAHKYIFIEHRTYASCKENMCCHCCSKMSNSDIILHIGYYKNQLLHRVLEYYGKSLDQMNTKIKNTAYGGGYSYLSELSLSEMQMLYQEVVISGNACKEISKVVYPTTAYLKLLEENNYNVIDAFNLRNEGESFISKEHI